MNPLDSDRAPHETAKALVLRLSELVIREGMHVSVQRGGIVEIRNPQGSTTTDTLGRALNPGMRQQIALREHGGVLWWCWLWSGPTRDAPPDIEPMCPAQDVKTAAARIGHVLSVVAP